ncbi:MAG: radical SAM protein [Magnetococcales bacterium]|nr:radical SAM protein [Magnetococcales bacterium]
MSARKMVHSLLQGSMIRAFRPAMGNLYSMMTGTPNSGSPFYVSWITTYGCNRKCLHCDWIWTRTSKEDLNRELTVDEKMTVADQIARSQTWGVTISGGEPLMLPGIMDVLRRLKEAGKRVNLCTNGVLLPRFAKDLLDMDIDSITVSMDSFRPEEHDHMRGVPGSYLKSMAGLRAIQNLRGTTKRPNIVIKAVISSFNFKEMPQWVETFQTIADEVEFQPVQNNLVHQIKSGEESLLFRPEHEEEFRQVLHDLAQRWRVFDAPYYRHMPEYVFRPLEFFDSGGFRCLFFSSFYMEINPYGDVGCCPGQYVLGNLKKDTLLDLWRRPATCDHQKSLRSKENRCLCWTYNSVFNLYLLPIFRRSPWIKDP